MGEKSEGVGVDECHVPLTGTSWKEVACVHKLRFGVKIRIVVTPKELAEFELESRELDMIAMQ